MAVIGHWLGAFPVCYFVPQASVALMCKLSMMADALAGLFVLLQVEVATPFAWYMSTPYPSTEESIAQWKASGEWLTSGPVKDQAHGDQGFDGYSALWPFYLDLKYSHTVEFMAILGVLIAAYMRLRYNISAGYCLGIMFAITSHPIMDMFFHDALFLMGNRAKTRCCIHFWQTPWMGPVAFVLEVVMAYLGYSMWLSTREPVDSKAETSANIAYYKKMFWMLALQHNMASLYVLSPVLVWGFSKWAPALQAFTPAAYWSMVLFAVTIWSWTFSLYPLHKIEGLTVVKKALAREADCYVEAP